MKIPVIQEKTRILFAYMIDTKKSRSQVNRGSTLNISKICDEINDYNNAEDDSVPAKSLKAVSADKSHKEFDSRKRYKEGRYDSHDHCDDLSLCEGQTVIHDVFQDFKTACTEHYGDSEKE